MKRNILQKNIGKKILVVDDEPVICKMLVKFLTKKGYQASSALSGEEGLKKIKEDKPAIVLLDIRMPKMDGIEVLRQIKKIDQKIGVVMITAVKEDEVGLECMKLGAYDYITKPIGLDYLQNVLTVKLLNCEDSFKKNS